MANEKDLNDQIIETIDEEGKVVRFELVDIIDFEDREYALMLPLDTEIEEEDDDEEKEVVVMRLVKDGDEFMFEAIEDDDEFEKIVEYVSALAEGEED